MVIATSMKPQNKVSTQAYVFLQKKPHYEPFWHWEFLCSFSSLSLCLVIKTCSPPYLLSTLSFLLALFHFPKTSSGLLKVHLCLPVCLCVHKYPLCPFLPCLMCSALCSIWYSTSDLFWGKKFPFQERIRILSWEILWIQF